MTTYYFFRFPDEWGVAPKLTRKRSDIEEIIDQKVKKAPVEIDTAKLDRARDDLTEKLWQRELETRPVLRGVDRSKIKYTSREDLAFKNQEEIEKTIRKRYTDEQREVQICLSCVDTIVARIVQIKNLPCIVYSVITKKQGSG